MQYVTLANGVKMPQLGYGVYQVSKEECILDALKVGYRHFDTAQCYLNEELVGNALAKSGIPRSEIFITGKVWISNYGYEKTKKSVLDSLSKLKTDYIDLMLLHQAFNDYYGAWRALEELYEEGKLKAIGVSNFYPDRLVDLCGFTRINPMVNQVELHPFYQRIEDQKWMQKYNVQIEGWSPFAEGRCDYFTNPIIEKIAKKHKKSNAQIILRWGIQRGVVMIPKASSLTHMKENFEIFDFQLTEEDMNVIAAMDTKKTAFMSQQEPETVEIVVKQVKDKLFE